MDLEQVISNSIADVAAGEGGSTETTEHVDSTSEAGTEVASSETSDSAETATEAPVVEQQAQTTTEDSFESLQNELAGKRDNRIPYNRVQRIVENARRKEADKVRGEIEQQYAQYRTPDFENTMRAWRMADENPRQFLEALASADPRYAELIAPAPQSHAQRAAGQATGSTEKPEPDVLLSDGRLAYSADQTEKLAAWHAQQRVEELERRYAERFGPIEQDYRVSKQVQSAYENVSNQLAEAEKWPGFSEAKADILAALQADRKLGLKDAYIRVVIPKLQPSRDRMRQEILAELNAKPRAASGVIPSAATVQSGAEPASIEDAIRQSIAGLKR